MLFFFGNFYVVGRDALKFFGEKNHLQVKKRGLNKIRRSSGISAVAKSTTRLNIVEDKKTNCNEIIEY